MRDPIRKNHEPIEISNWEMLLYGIKVIWCPMCGTVNEVPKNDDPAGHNCFECGQNLGEDPEERMIEVTSKKRGHTYD